MRNLRILLLTIFFGFTAFQAGATHLLGGEITWECTPNGDYEFTVIVYKECGQGAAPGVSNFFHGPWGTVAMSPAVVTEVSPVCKNSSGTKCNVWQSGEGAVQKFTFTHVISKNSLSGVPPANGWEFYWTSSARPSLVNSTASGYYLRAKMYPYTPVGATSPVNANPCIDNSPYFSEVGSLTVCTGAPFVYNHLAADKDIDSVYTRFAEPKQTATGVFPWNAGYSIPSPYPSNITNPANGPVTLDGTTGAVSMNVQVATPGNYVSCYEIQSFKRGMDANGKLAMIKVASVYRDVTIVFRDDCGINNEPDGGVDTVNYPSIKQIGPKTYKTRVYPGDLVNFVISANDNDAFPPAYQLQNITFEAAGLQVSNPLGSGVGCDGIAPCATFTPVAPQTGYVKPGLNTMEFSWVPDCQHLSVYGNYLNPFNTFLFSMRMQDDGCPAPRISLTTLIIEVIAGDPSPVNFTCLDLDPVSDERKLSWQKALIDSSLGFNYYMILAGPNSNGTYDTIQKIYDIDSLGTVVPGSSGYTDFYIVKSTGKCDFFSKPSDTLSVMDLNLNVVTTSLGDYADLTWSPLGVPTLPKTSNGVYEVWREVPAGSGNWSKIAETTNLNYTDLIQVCDMLVSYQIRVGDTAAQCTSNSDIEVGRFSDKSNTDTLKIDSVSVNLNGNSIISWSPTSKGDVVEYYLLFNDPVVGWDIVDTIPLGATMPHEWTNSEADTRSEEFKIISADSCGNWSDQQLVRPHSSIYLRNYLNKCEGYSRLSWNTYEGFGRDAVGEYRIWMQEIVNGTPMGWRILDVRDGNDTVYFQRDLEKGYEYCYRIQAIDTSGVRSSTSNEQCVFAQVPIKSKVLYLAQVTNNLDRNAVEINTYIDAQADVISFDLERAPDPKGPFERIATIPKPATGITFGFFDYGVDPSKNVFYYRVSARDSCGGRDTVSMLSNNVLLNVQPQADVSNLLTWNHYKTWDGEVDSYEIYRQGGDETGYSLLAQVSGDDSSYVDEFDRAVYGDGRGNFCYYIRAIEGANSLAFVKPNGDPYDSRSNSVCINQRARVFVPTAFNPGSDKEVNRSFGPSMKFTEVEEYYFYVMNRWGVKVFETTDPEERWDGTYEGKEAPLGVYIYFLRYATPGDATKEDRGSFTLIR